MAKRTVLEFSVDQDVWPTVAGWAAREGFRQVESHESTRRYQKGHGFWVAPVMAEISQVEGRVRVEAWIRANIIARAGALFLIPAEMGVESGGFRGVLPRRIGRNAVNQLLATLGQAPIP